MYHALHYRVAQAMQCDVMKCVSIVCVNTEPAAIFIVTLTE